MHLKKLGRTAGILAAAEMPHLLALYLYIREQRIPFKVLSTQDQVLALAARGIRNRLRDQQKLIESSEMIQTSFVVGKAEPILYLGGSYYRRDINKRVWITAARYIELLAEISPTLDTFLQVGLEEIAEDFIAQSKVTL